MPRPLWTISPRSVLGRVLRAPLRLIPSDTVVHVRGGVNKGMRWVVGSSVHGCWLGHYEQAKQVALRRFLSAGMRVFDIGANAGFYTLAAARGVAPGGHVWAFEPYAENVRNLHLHIELNGLANVTLVQSAVAAQTGLAGFAVAKNNSMGHLALDSDYVVPTLSIDDFCTLRNIGVPDLMKIDVEGAELQVLEGARRVLVESSPVIFLSLHGLDQEIGCTNFLEELGYRLCYLNGGAAHDRPLQSDEVIAIPGNYKTARTFLDGQKATT